MSNPMAEETGVVSGGKTAQVREALIAFQREAFFAVVRSSSADGCD